MKRIPFHPFFFAAYPVLSLYSENTAIIPAADLWAPLGCVVLAAMALWAVLALILRSPERGAAGASVAALGFFSYGPIASVAHVIYYRDVRDLFSMFWIWAPLYIALVVAACWRWRRTPALTGGLNAASVVLAAIPALSICLAWLRGRETIPQNRDNPHAAQFRGSRPDIFYVILDGFGRQDSLRRDMGLDDSEFIDGLRKRGFYVADSGHTNYCQTELSLTSSLNMGFLPEVVPHFSPTAEKRDTLDALIDRNRVSQVLRQYGYGYIAVTTNFPAVRPRSADLLIQEESGATLFETALVARTPLPSGNSLTESQFDSRRENLRAAIGMVGKLGEAGSKPRFIFAHILAPHPPFVFGPDGESIRPHRMYTIVDGSHFYEYGGTLDEYRRGYSGQAKAIGDMTLAAIDVLLQKETSPPIIIIQGDHGPKMRYDQELLAKTDVNEVFPNLNAYYVPTDIRSKLYPTITPVNSFRTILREHFGEDLPNLPDRSWYSGWTRPFRLEEVTDRIKPKL